MISYVCHQLIQMYSNNYQFPKTNFSNGDAQIISLEMLITIWRKHCKYLQYVNWKCQHTQRIGGYEVLWL